MAVAGLKSLVLVTIFGHLPLFPGESNPEKNLKEQQTSSSGENNSDLLGLQL